MRKIIIKLYSFWLFLISKGKMRANCAPFLEITCFPNHVGKGCYFQKNTWINKTKASYLSIGDRCYFGHGCQINAYENVQIGDDVMISDNVYISDADHVFEETSVPIKDQGIKTQPVVISDGAWIGRNAVIMPGVLIGVNSVIGANSVVTKDIQAGVVVAGVPARVMRKI